MHSNILRSTLYTRKYLSKEIKGTVHSVYRKTINILAGEKLFAIQAKASPLSPISLSTDLDQEQMSLICTEPGMPVTITPDAISIRLTNGGEYLFSLKNTLFSDLELQSNLTSSQLHELQGKLYDVICHSASGGYDLIFQNSPLVKENLFLLAARGRMEAARDLFLAGDFTGTSAELIKLIGLGMGLTPSGDDFLCGVFAGLTLLGKQSHPFAECMRTNILSHLCDTNPVSGAFLICSLAGQFSEAINLLPSLPDQQKILNAFQEIGHSSGLDSLCGVYYSILLFNNIL